MIVALGLPLRSVANVELQRAFNCLLDNVQFPSPSTIKNRLMTRSQDIIPLLLERLPRGSSKVSLALDCWSSFNRQGYLANSAALMELPDLGSVSLPRKYGLEYKSRSRKARCSKMAKGI